MSELLLWLFGFAIGFVMGGVVMYRLGRDELQVDKPVEPAPEPKYTVPVPPPAAARRRNTPDTSNYCDCDMHEICKTCTRKNLQRCLIEGLYTGYVRKDDEIDGLEAGSTKAV